MGKLNKKQWRAVWVTLVVALLFAAIALWWETVLVLVLGGVAVWKLNSTEKPEIAVVKSVRCGGCGAIGEPHWKSCPRCGATNWV
jgi:hypothetical protein